jgi:hypothetical protein
MPGILWWAGQIILIIVGLFFLLFGIHLLIAAYQLKDPSYFILTFFASNFIILISATLLLGFIFRIIRSFRNPEDDEKV